MEILLFDTSILKVIVYWYPYQVPIVGYKPLYTLDIGIYNMIDINYFIGFMN